MPVHAVWAGGRAGFWAEGSPCPATSEHHPFAGPPEELDGRPEEVVLRLPSDADGPVHSSFTTATHLREWSLPVVFPGDLPELEEPSGSVRFLAALDDFARDLVRRGRVLPGLVGREARWRPVLTGADAGRAAELAAAMPPVFRAADA
ncbi:ATP-dependent helicase, partial [Herbidospora galbida]